MVRNESSSNSAPAHNTKINQDWLWRYIPVFIRAKDWPSGSPDLNPLEYKLWAVLEDKSCQKHHNTLDSLKRSLMIEAAGIPVEMVRAAIAEWLERLKAQGGHFEWH